MAFGSMLDFDLYPPPYCVPSHSSFFLPAATPHVTCFPFVFFRLERESSSSGVVSICQFHVCILGVAKKDRLDGRALNLVQVSTVLRVRVRECG